jgi:flagellar protein FlaG
MPGTSASHLIFFIAAMVVASAVAGIFVTTTLNFSKDIRRQAEARSNDLNTQVTIINDASAMPYNSTAQTLILYVKNIGSTSISPNSTRVLMDGWWNASWNLTTKLLDNASAWTNEAVLEVTIGNITLSSGDHRAKLSVAGKEFVEFKFKI